MSIEARSEKPAAGVRLVRVEPDRAGQRLDNFLLGQLKGAPRSLVYKIVRSGQVRVNGGRAKAERRLEAGDRPQILGPTLRAFLFGTAAVVGIQFLYVGSAYPWLHCSAFADITGAVLLGLAPLMLSYLIVAALASLLASSPEK